MNKIIVLPKNIADLIAAGEVADRPASVVKEILENSIDAEASEIYCEIKAGGIKYIRVVDNGCGMSQDDAKLAFLRHATSKIRSENDLVAIGTLGFRGEALAAISAVSKIELITKNEESEFAYRVVLEAGEIIESGECAGTLGTSITITDLFYNTPARMKFLKRDSTEAGAIASVIERITLSSPNVRIQFVNEGKDELFHGGNSDFYTAIYNVFGKETANSLIPVNNNFSGIKVTGYVSKPEYSRSNRNMQIFFINGRSVKSKTFIAASEQAYKNSMMTGKFPMLFLNITLNLELVDVNVHPSKAEVKFSHENLMFQAVYYAIKNELGANLKPMTSDLFKGKTEDKEFIETQVSDNIIKKEEQTNPELQGFPFGFISLKEQTSQVFHDKPLPFNSNIKYNINIVPKETESKSIENNKIEKDEENKNLIENVDNFAITTENIPIEEKGIAFKLIGQAFQTFIIIEVDDELLLIDKHAAHERIIFEKLKNAEQKVTTQELIEPVIVELTKEERNILLESLELLTAHGILCEDFGQSSVIVRGLPVDSGSPKDLIVELATILLDNKTDTTTKKQEHILQTIACKAAIKAGQKTSDFELCKLANEVLSRNEIRYCPHGRPIVVSITKEQLLKQFKRIRS